MKIKKQNLKNNPAEQNVPRGDFLCANYIYLFAKEIRNETVKTLMADGEIYSHEITSLHMQKKLQIPHPLKFTLLQAPKAFTFGKWNWLINNYFSELTNKFSAFRM